MIYLRWVAAPLLLIVIWFAAVFMIENSFAVLHPSAVLGVAALSGCFGVAISTLRRHNSVHRCGGFVALCAAYLACLAPFNDQPVTRFRASYKSIQVGMSAAAVDAVTASHFPHRKPNMGWDQGHRQFGAYLIDLDPSLSAFLTMVLEYGRVVSTFYGTD